MNIIKFSHNWNKKLEHSVFTTIRKYTEEKYSYYDDKIGQKFSIFCNEASMGDCVLVNAERKMFKELPLGLLHSDTGLVNIYEIFDLFKKFGINKDDKVIILTFKRINEAS